VTLDQGASCRDVSVKFVGGETPDGRNPRAAVSAAIVADRLRTTRDQTQQVAERTLKRGGVCHGNRGVALSEIRAGRAGDVEPRLSGLPREYE
jgi:hypothetical protein